MLDQGEYQGPTNAMLMIKTKANARDKIILIMPSVADSNLVIDYLNNPHIAYGVQALHSFTQDTELLPTGE